MCGRRIVEPRNRSRLKLTEHTVKNYLFRIFDKLGVSSRVEVVLYVFRLRKELGANVPDNQCTQCLTVYESAQAKTSPSRPMPVKRAVEPVRELERSGVAANCQASPAGLFLNQRGSLHSYPTVVPILPLPCLRCCVRSAGTPSAPKKER